MRKIVESVKRVTDLMAEISNAGLEQSAGIEQINQAIIQIDAVTQQNAALVEETAATATAMRNEANRLTQAIQVFQLANQDSLQVTDPDSQPRTSTSLALQ